MAPKSAGVDILAKAEERLSISDEVAALKRERTLDAATDLFYEKGYSNTTLDDVAAALGVAKPFIYKHFGSKHMLLATICARGIQAALDAVEFALANGEGPSDSLMIFVPRYVQAIIDMQKCIAIHIREEKNLRPEDVENLAALRQKFMSRTEELLAIGKASEELEIADPRVSAFAIVGAVSWITFWYHPDGPLTPDDVIERMTSFILNLLRSESSTLPG
ncbi:TetR/AcrR family transcriptional regulator [Martelella sp. AMO21009]